MVINAIARYLILFYILSFDLPIILLIEWIATLIYQAPSGANICGLIFTDVAEAAFALRMLFGVLRHCAVDSRDALCK